ncbi:unnamed protein product [Peniophora sp. CBMAI 1063]|nr:unnamed protein product [Peniophora sp. CBMAI 1063]
MDEVSYHEELIEFFVADIGDHDLILGTDWLHTHNPEVDWSKSRVDMTRCPPDCTLVNPPVTHLRTLHPLSLKRPVLIEEIDDDEDIHLRAWQRASALPADSPILINTDNDAPELLSVPAARKNPVTVENVPDAEDIRLRLQLRACSLDTTLDELPTVKEASAVLSTPAVSFQLEQNYKDELEDVASIPVSVDWVLRGLQLAWIVLDIKHCTFEPGNTILFTTDYTEDPEDDKLVEEHAAQTPAKSLEELVPEQYRPWIKVFDKKVSERLPEHGKHNHTIDLKPEFEKHLETHPINAKLYPQPGNEKAAIEVFVKEHRDHGTIRPSKSPMASLFFFVKKKDSTLHPVQDYCILNLGTIKNTYPLPLIGDIVDRLTGAKVFSKMDVRWGYNNIRIKEGDEWKAAFKTSLGLFEPLVMFFGLTNSPATFQTMINEVFRDMINEGVISIYMDDILVHTKDITQHRDIVQRVLQRLEENNLYLKPERCQFEQDQFEFLGLVISHNHLAMDLVKVAGVMDWPRLRNVKEVQSFIGFANFYRRFITDFLFIARPLFELTKKMVAWRWEEVEQEAFDKMKHAFTSSPVLLMPDPTKPYQVECDVSDFAIGAVLSQRGEDNDWHPVAYLSHALTALECNYDTHDKELLAIICALEDWHHYLEGSPHQVEIFTNHKNLEYFTTAQKLNRRQARWALYLSRFDFILRRRPGRYNHADPMSRHPDHRLGISEDNSNHVLFLAAEVSINATQLVSLDDVRQQILDTDTKDQKVTEALHIIQEEGLVALKHKLVGWEQKDGLLTYNGRLYIPDNQDLRRDIVRLCHDTPAAGHPGRMRTMELVQRDFWWPGMSVFIREYIRGYATCQRMKIRNHPPEVPLHPNKVPTCPFQIMMTDFITNLPPCQDFDSIAVYVDRGYKMVYIAPTTKTVDSLGSASLFMRYVFSHTGLMEQLISDRGNQFASETTRTLLTKLGVKSSLSTSYHPQTDGQTEHFNQELEQYLRAFCNFHQDDWASTGKSPFELLYGFTPHAYPQLNPAARFPHLRDWLRHLESVCEEAQASLRIAAELMKDCYGVPEASYKPFKVGDKVWLEGKNLKSIQPKAKLDAKRHGPITITEVLGNPETAINFCLDILKTWKWIHTVFHTQLLTPYVETPEHGPNYMEEPPELVDDKEEYVVEAILNGQETRNKRGFEYLVKWEGYPDMANLWRPASALKNAKDAIAEYHKRHPRAPHPKNYQGP